ncbi:hypothetical protein H0H92_009226 [Tricholoma furcatifolium]|nr:hypothetical protein H0H92_009226 [Tricholoma furcatifolium]
MAAISIDVAGILQEIRTTIQLIKGAKALDKKAKQNARRTVYQAFSLHPALDHIHPAEKHLTDADWYLARVEDRSKAKAVLGSSRHRIAGPVGTRARIMMLLLWLLGHRLTRDKRTQLVSTAISHGLRGRSPEEGNLVELLDLDYVQAVIQDLSQMMGEKLPIDPLLNPFGPHYTPSKQRDEDRLDVFDVPSMPSNWKRYDWDIKSNPALLLKRPSEKMVIIPETRLSLLLLRYVSQIYGLGNIINTGGVNEDAFWNAGLPIDHTHDDLQWRMERSLRYSQESITQNMQNPQLSATSESPPSTLQLVQSAASDVQIKKEMPFIIRALCSHPLQDYIHLDSTVDKILPNSRNSEVSHLRTAIMLSLLQVIGQGLSNGQRLGLLTAAVTRGLSTAVSQGVDQTDTPQHLVKSDLVFNYFKHMTPFGTDTICNLCKCAEEEEDNPAPSVAPSTLSSSTQLLYWDAKRDPEFLLQLELKPSSGRQIIVPLTKLSLHILCNVASIFGIGSLLDSSTTREGRFCTSAIFLQNNNIALVPPDPDSMRARAGDQRKQAEELRQQAYSLNSQVNTLRRQANDLEQQANALHKRANGLSNASESLERLLALYGQI